MIIKKQEYEELKRKAEKAEKEHQPKSIHITIDKYAFSNQYPCLMTHQLFKIKSTIDLSEGVERQILNIIGEVRTKYESIIDAQVEQKLDEKIQRLNIEKNNNKLELLEELEKCNIFNVFRRMRHKISGL